MKSHFISKVDNKILLLKITSALSPTGQCTKHSQGELPHVQGQGQKPRVPACDGAGTSERSHPASKVGAAARRSNPTPQARGGGQEDQPHAQGVVAAWAQEGLEEPSHVESQEGQQ